MIFLYSYFTLSIADACIHLTLIAPSHCVNAIISVGFPQIYVRLHYNNKFFVASTIFHITALPIFA